MFSADQQLDGDQQNHHCHGRGHPWNSAQRGSQDDARQEQQRAERSASNRFHDRPQGNTVPATRDFFDSVKKLLQVRDFLIHACTPWGGCERRTVKQILILLFTVFRLVSEFLLSHGNINPQIKRPFVQFKFVHLESHAV